MTDRVLAIVGPTGTGKSAVALEIAERLDAEVVAVDAFTVYRGMDIGTAKPSQADRTRIPHHMIDVLDPAQACTVQWFQGAAREAIARVRAREKTPLLVGGSGLYFRAVVDPLEFPPTDPDVRDVIEDRYRADPAAAHRALQAADPAAAACIEPGNLRRSVRALEVIAVTGRAFSDWRRAWEAYESIYPDLHIVGLDLPRDQLTAQLDARVDRMFARGFVEECQALTAHPLSRTARQAIGYAEVLEYLAGACQLDEAAERIKARTRQYATRQRRWFGHDSRVRWTSPTVRHIHEVFPSPCGS
ncbi:MAG: tRNA (adenosine(37)-N6)-dimethylallyltransferase MiaA [Egibacteraceae bacterium]